MKRAPRRVFAAEYKSEAIKFAEALFKDAASQSPPPPARFHCPRAKPRRRNIQLLLDAASRIFRTLPERRLHRPPRKVLRYLSRIRPADPVPNEGAGFARASQRCVCHEVRPV